VSIRPKGTSGLGTRTELKNLNSFRFVEKAIEHEINRQKDVLMDGGAIVQETRLWDQDSGRTVPMRARKRPTTTAIFRTPTSCLGDRCAMIERVRRSLPELPDARRVRFVEQYGLPDYAAGVLTSDRELADYFEACLKAFPSPRPSATGSWAPFSVC